MAWRRLYLWLFGLLIGIPAIVAVATIDNLLLPPKVLWAAEFNGPAGAPPPAKDWAFEIGDGSVRHLPGWGNDELQYYTNGNAVQDGKGHLVISAHELPENSVLTCYYGPCRFSSARLTTNGRLAWQYGRIEARMQVPAASGTWPALWSLGNNFDTVSWPRSGEIDIAEFFGSAPETVVGGVHAEGFAGQKRGTRTFDAEEPISGFHVYGMTWTPDRIEWTFDGRSFGAITKDDVPPGTWAFDRLYFLMLNLAIGGTYAGDVDGGFDEPQRLVIDWIRITETDGYGAVLQGQRVYA